jgi:hypothetical protein
MKQVIFSHDAVGKSRDLADLIKSNLKAEVIGESANITEKVDHASYDANLPEGLTPELVGKLSKYHGSFSRAQHVAFAETAAEVFNANAGINRIEGKIGVFAHGDHSDMTIDRSRTFPNNKAKEGEATTVEKMLYITESTTHKGMSFKALKNAMSLEFNEAQGPGKVIAKVVAV